MELISICLLWEKKEIIKADNIMNRYSEMVQID